MANKQKTKGKNKSKRGITLISLVVTIIVLLILAGISVTMLAGENNIIKKAGQAADETKLAAYKDEISLSSIGSIDESGKNNIEKVKQQLDNTEKYNTSILGDTLVIITKKENYVFEIDQEGETQFKGIRINTTNDEPIMMKRDDNQAFWKEEYRTNISRVEIKNYITTSPKAIKEWDVSNKKNHSVMAWIESDGNDGYILYIAANGKIKMTNFFGCNKIEKIIMPGNNEKATGVGSMFQGCWAKEIDISGITCQNVQSVRCMFHNYGIPNIEEPRKIDISSMVFDNITDHEYFIRDGYTSKDIVYVKDKAGQDFVIMQNTRNLFSTENVIIK